MNNQIYKEIIDIEKLEKYKKKQMLLNSDFWSVICGIKK